MKDLNRIKLVFVENKKLVNGWQKNCTRTLVQSLNDVPTPLNLILATC